MSKNELKELEEFLRWLDIDPPEKGTPVSTETTTYTDVLKDGTKIITIFITRIVKKGDPRQRDQYRS